MMPLRLAPDMAISVVIDPSLQRAQTCPDEDPSLASHACRGGRGRPRYQ